LSPRKLSFTLKVGGSNGYVWFLIAMITRKMPTRSIWQRRAGQDSGMMKGGRQFFEAIVSVPCFELWLLLHFSNVQSWIHSDRALCELRVYIPNYAKGMPNVFDATAPHRSTAVDRATSLKHRFQRLPGDEPYTDVHELVMVLLSLRRRLNRPSCSS
jgi:hypothetical protein